MAEKLTFPAFTTPDYATVLADLNRLPEKASRNLKNAFGIITERAANTIGVSRANIWLFTDANRTTLRCIDLYDYATRTHSDNGTLLGEQFPNYIQALKSERVIIADDAAHDPRTQEFAAQYLPAHNTTRR